MTNGATTIYANATIITMDPTTPRAEALAVRDGRVLAVGSIDDVRDAAGSGAKEVDLAGNTIVPGFDDCHMHILSYGLNLEQLDVSSRAAPTIADVRRLVAERAANATGDEWIRGRGYNQNLLAERRHPNRHDLDEAGGGRPAVLWHTSGHVLACNSRALQLAGITRNTPDPSGGEVERDEHGDPTGVLKETAMPLVGRVIPRPTHQQSTEAIINAMTALAAEGITSASDANTGGWEDIELELSAYRAALGSGRLVGRIILMPHITTILDPELDEPARPPTAFDAGDQPDRLRIGATKIFSDGALTTRTAAVREPYLDVQRSNTRKRVPDVQREGSGKDRRDTEPMGNGAGEGMGLLTWEPGVLKSMIKRAHRAGWQIATHAIGNRAIDVVLDGYEAAQAGVPRADARHRIEHCTLADEVQVARINALGVVPVLQPEDIAVLGDAYIPALGRERADDNSPVRWFIDRQVLIAFSSDRPVTPGSPFWGIRAAMERRTPEGVIMGAQHRASADHAIRFYTVGSAFATFSEQLKGALKPGMLADFVVLDRDVTRVPAEEITSTLVMMTVVGGEVVFER